MEEELKDEIKNLNLPQFPDLTKIHKELKEKAKANIQHTWRQQGPQIVCVSCNFQHAQYIGMDKKLTGFGEGGKPIIK